MLTRRFDPGVMACCRKEILWRLFDAKFLADVLLAGRLDEVLAHNVRKEGRSHAVFFVKAVRNGKNVVAPEVQQFPGAEILKQLELCPRRARKDHESVRNKGQRFSGIHRLAERERIELEVTGRPEYEQALRIFILKRLMTDHMDSMFAKVPSEAT
jgi:hypothetical protein